MNTVVIKWNPPYSTYSMLNYLYDVTVLNQGYPTRQHCAVWDSEKIQRGDRFYWLKLGHGQVGVLGCGIITSDPYEDLDTEEHDHQIFYVDLTPEILLCPEVVDLLPLDIVEKEIPDFDWRGGHSGVVLNRHQTKKLDELWNSFRISNKDIWKAAKENCRFPDTVYLAPKKPVQKKSKKED